MDVTIRESVCGAIYNHAKQTYPNECCGFLYGNDKNPREILLAQRIDNAREGDQRARFEINPDDYRKAEEYARKNQLSFLGIYHSHPDHPAVPSDYDLKHAFPFFSYIIVSLNKSKILDLRSWRLEDSSFEEEILNEDLVLNC